ncbi:MAG: hypothetical protein HY532_00565 [Chloroflexi bacterium]|nr:hypothetical protein [Chloroflexota bacterium]
MTRPRFYQRPSVDPLQTPEQTFLVHSCRAAGASLLCSDRCASCLLPGKDLCNLWGTGQVCKVCPCRQRYSPTLVRGVGGLGRQEPVYRRSP